MGTARVIKVENVTYKDFPMAVKLEEISSNHTLSVILGFIRKIGVANMEELKYFLRAKSCDAVSHLLERCHYNEIVDAAERDKNLAWIKREQGVATKQDGANQYVIRLNDILDQCLNRGKPFDFEKEIAAALKAQKRGFDKGVEQLPEPEPITIGNLVFVDFPTFEQMLEQPHEIKKFFFEFAPALGIEGPEMTAKYLHTRNQKAVADLIESSHPDQSAYADERRLYNLQAEMLRGFEEPTPYQLSVNDLIRRSKRQRLSTRHCTDLYKEVEIVLKSIAREKENQTKQPAQKPEPAKKPAPAPENGLHLEVTVKIQIV